jgi:hypothetical protein
MQILKVLISPLFQKHHQKQRSKTVSLFYKKAKNLLVFRRLPLPRKPVPEVLPDPAVILPEVPVHRGVKSGDPDFSPSYKKIKSFPVSESAERGKRIRDS